MIIDETYAADPTAYDGAAALEEWGFTAADMAEVPAAAASKVSASVRPVFQSLRRECVHGFPAVGAY